MIMINLDKPIINKSIRNARKLIKLFNLLIKDCPNSNQKKIKGRVRDRDNLLLNKILKAEKLYARREDPELVADKVDLDQKIEIITNRISDLPFNKIFPNKSKPAAPTSGQPPYLLTPTTCPRKSLRGLAWQSIED